MYIQIKNPPMLKQFNLEEIVSLHTESVLTQNTLTGDMSHRTLTLVHVHRRTSAKRPIHSDMYTKTCAHMNGCCHRLSAIDFPFLTPFISSSLLILPSSCLYHTPFPYFLPYLPFLFFLLLSPLLSPPLSPPPSPLLSFPELAVKAALLSVHGYLLEPSHHMLPLHVTLPHP